MQTAGGRGGLVDGRPKDGANANARMRRPPTGSSALARASIAAVLNSSIREERKIHSGRRCRPQEVAADLWTAAAKDGANASIPMWRPPTGSSALARASMAGFEFFDSGGEEDPLRPAVQTAGGRGGLVDGRREGRRERERSHVAPAHRVFRACPRENRPGFESSIRGGEIEIDGDLRAAAGATTPCIWPARRPQTAEWAACQSGFQCAASENHSESWALRGNRSVRTSSSLREAATSSAPTPPSARTSRARST